MSKTRTYLFRESEDLAQCRAVIVGAPHELQEDGRHFVIEGQKNNAGVVHVFGHRGDGECNADPGRDERDERPRVGSHLHDGGHEAGRAGQSHEVVAQDRAGVLRQRYEVFADEIFHGNGLSIGERMAGVDRDHEVLIGDHPMFDAGRDEVPPPQSDLHLLVDHLVERGGGEVRAVELEVDSRVGRAH